MNKSYFLDTSYIIALEIANEDTHEQVLQNWLTLALSKPFLVTTTYVFDETVTFFNSRNLHGKAVEIGKRLRESPDIELIEIDRDLFDRGWQYFQKYQDKSYSLTDCLSFIVMENRRIFTALSLDNHFLQAGFQKLP
ncbi:type II toxin-antitoxin system VapC family toxin [Microcystis aeruginosa]|jgi:predicted nucleic acid-binding protein|uniref:PIN domain-containing protein n=1 Tax=Microcystis aeruginosa FD4 TaxID=2686288 RepID=A0A857D3M8_MICAE|nr:PIN domain-containing protein [Microcystis aeruginosa]QGZ90257.1 PIN domain-containing protein [Microcystis aeruginosa FD4]